MKKKFIKTSAVAFAFGGIAPKYDILLEKISNAFSIGQRRVAQAVNSGIIKTYWEIGHHIVEFEQGGNIRAEYGKGRSGGNRRLHRNRRGTNHCEAKIKTNQFNAKTRRRKGRKSFSLRLRVLR